MSGSPPIPFPSRFARRLFAWFATATVLPMLLLGGMSYYEVQDNLVENTQRQLRRVAKTLGMYLFARLDELDDTLSQLPPEDPEARQVRGVDSVTELPPGMLQEPETSVQTRLFERFDKRSNTYQALLVPTAWRASQGLRYAVVISPDYLLAPEELLPSDVAFCLTGLNSRAFHCNDEQIAPLLPELAQQRRQRSTGSFSWKGDDSGLAAYWSLFLRERFGAPDWAVLVARSDEVIYAPLKRFNQLFPRVALLAIMLAMVFAYGQLRQRLRPLGSMVEATRRFAVGDFSARVAIDSSDEFGQLASAFNTMAADTDLHFKRLAALAELDRLILSSFDEKHIIEQTLIRVSGLIGAQRMGFIALSPNSTTVGLVVSRPASEQVDEEEFAVSAGLFRWLAAMDGPATVTSGDLQHVPKIGKSDTLTLVPVYQQGRRFGALMVDCADLRLQPELIRVLGEFSDRLAVALSNAAWEGELYHQAHYDALTGLPNRALLTDRLEQALLRADRNRNRCAVLFIDLDGFKSVNDTLGHHEGDTLLHIAAQRLSEAARTADSVVRFGGDEFVILISDLPEQDDLAMNLSATAERLIEALSQPVELAGHRLALGASVGIALYPGDGDTGADLLRNADAAMYQAKEWGRGHAVFYTAQMNQDVLERLSLRQDLSEALSNTEQLFLEYQPQVCARSGVLVGVEALVRWRHPTRGLISPGSFIPMAEESGLIVPLGDWVLRRACETVRRLSDRGVHIPRIAVNVAANQFWTPDFLEKVESVLTDSRLPASMLELEVTEGTMMQDVARGSEMLTHLSEAGIRLAIDDFGTGYSSLSYLQWLPLHRLKIDQGFIRRLGDDGASDAIVAAIVALGKRLGLSLIAEGVENEAQAELLRRLECDEFQGFLFSRPLAEGALIDWYHAGQPVSDERKTQALGL